MVLLDTSIWIEYLKKSRKYFFQVKELLETGQVLANQCVFGELLRGVRNTKELKIVMEFWKSLAKVSEEDLWIEAGSFSYEKKLYSKGVGIIDLVILLSARRAKAKLWTLDSNLDKLLKKGERYEFK